jgi:hypothetical protein
MKAILWLALMAPAAVSFVGGRLYGELINWLALEWALAPGWVSGLWLAGALVVWLLWAGGAAWAYRLVTRP